jgi:FkbH-like protein
MVARIGPVVDSTLERTVQLINRSNQFNLTTRRYSNADVHGLMSNPIWITRTVSLSDRFGDSGLISVLLAKEDSDALIIDTWLMSCRVLKRGVERLLLNNIVSYANARGLNRIVGDYIPTPKNALVRDHYRTLGFMQLESRIDGHTHWELRIDSHWKPQKHFIRESIQ